MPGRLRRIRGHLVYRRADGALKIGRYRYARRMPSLDGKRRAKHGYKKGYSHAGDRNRRKRSKRGWF